jgi:hypothetical protein
MKFHPWALPNDLLKSHETIGEDVFKNELEILSARIENEAIVISCNKDAYGGGELILICESVEVFDQEWKAVDVDDLIALNNQYWKK